MLRTIKFRGKTLDGKWVHGDLLHCEHDIKIRQGLETATVTEDTIGQFTGLKDADGKEIYEGDIIFSEKYQYVKHLVYYDEKESRYKAAMNLDKHNAFGLNQNWIDEFGKKVIGNIHDNHYRP